MSEYKDKLIQQLIETVRKVSDQYVGTIDSDRALAAIDATLKGLFKDNDKIRWTLRYDDDDPQKVLVDLKMDVNMITGKFSIKEDEL